MLSQGLNADKMHMVLQFLVPIFLVKAKINVCFLQAYGPASNNDSPDFRTRFPDDGLHWHIDVFAAGQVHVGDFGQFCRVEKVSEILGRDVIGMVQ